MPLGKRLFIAALAVVAAHCAPYVDNGEITAFPSKDDFSLGGSDESWKDFNISSVEAPVDCLEKTCHNYSSFLGPNDSLFLRTFTVDDAVRLTGFVAGLKDAQLALYHVTPQLEKVDLVQSSSPLANEHASNIVTQCITNPGEYGWAVTSSWSSGEISAWLLDPHPDFICDELARSDVEQGSLSPVNGNIDSNNVKVEEGLVGGDGEIDSNFDEKINGSLVNNSNTNDNAEQEPTSDAMALSNPGINEDKSDQSDIIYEGVFDASSWNAEWENSAPVQSSNPNLETGYTLSQQAEDELPNKVSGVDTIGETNGPITEQENIDAQSTSLPVHFPVQQLDNSKESAEEVEVKETETETKAITETKTKAMTETETKTKTEFVTESGTEAAAVSVSEAEEPIPAQVTVAVTTRHAKLATIGLWLALVALLLLILLLLCLLLARRNVRRKVIVSRPLIVEPSTSLLPWMKATDLSARKIDSGSDQPPPWTLTPERKRKTSIGRTKMEKSCTGLSYEGVADVPGHGDTATYAQPHSRLTNQTNALSTPLQEPSDSRHSIPQSTKEFLESRVTMARQWSDPLGGPMSDELNTRGWMGHGKGEMMSSASFENIDLGQMEKIEEKMKSRSAIPSSRNRSLASVWPQRHPKQRASFT